MQIKESKNRIVLLLRKIIKEERHKMLESSFDDEVDDLAIQLIDYLGTELPKQGWNTNPRIVSWFKENGIKINTSIAQGIYRKALELNRDNEPKSKKYLNN